MLQVVVVLTFCVLIRVCFAVPKRKPVRRWKQLASILPCTRMFVMRGSYHTYTRTMSYLASLVTP